MNYQFDKTINQIIYAGWAVVNYFSGFRVPEIDVFKTILQGMNYDTPKTAILKFYDFYQSVGDSNVYSQLRSKLFQLLDVEAPQVKGCCLFKKVDKNSLAKAVKELDDKVLEIRQNDLDATHKLKAS